MMQWVLNILDRHRARLIDTLTAEAVRSRKKIGQLDKDIVQKRDEIFQLGDEIVQRREEIDLLNKQVRQHREEIDQLSKQLAATAQAEARYRKEARCRQLIGGAIARYFIMGERNGGASIAFEDVTVDSNPDWIPEILARSDVSEPEFMIFRHFLQDDGAILDIGANYGYAAASIWAAGASSKILSFEPNPWHDPCLLRIKEARRGHFDYVKFGLGSKDNQTRFVIPVIERIGISALSSSSIEAEIDWTIPENVLHHMMHDHPDLESPRLQFTEVVWQTKRLDDVLRTYSFDIDLSNISALKIDVEGSEADVLVGAVQTLQTQKPLIMVEGANRNPGVVGCLSPIGYCYAEFVDDYVVAFDTQSSRANGFFLHKEKLDFYRSIGLLRS